MMTENVVALPTLHQLAWTMVHSVWQGLVVVAIFLVGRSLYRDASKRYMLGLLCLLGFLAMQVATVMWSQRWERGEGLEPPLRLLADRSPSPRIDARLDLFGTRSFDELPEESALLRIARKYAPAVSLLGWLWLVGVVACVSRYAIAFALLRRELKRCRPLSEDETHSFRTLAEKLELGRRVDFVETRQSSVPATCGWLHPVVLLPAADILSMTAADRKAMVLHELAHIWRRDSLTYQLRCLLRLVYFFHPIIIWLDRRLTDESEKAADEIAATVLGDRKQYASALLRLEEARLSSLALGAGGGSLKDRLVHLVSRRQHKPASSPLLSLLSIGLCSLLLLMTCGQLVAEAASPDQRLLASLRERNLPEAVLEALNMRSDTDHVTPWLSKAVVEQESGGAVSNETLRELVDAFHRGTVPDLVIREWVGHMRQSRPADWPAGKLGSFKTRLAISKQLGALASNEADSFQRARLARATYALLALEAVCYNGLDAHVWNATPSNVELMRLDPQTQRCIDFATALQNQRTGLARPLAERFADSDASSAQTAIEAAAYTVGWQRIFAVMASPADWRRLQELLPLSNDNVQRRWRQMFPDELYAHDEDQKRQ